MSWVEVYPIQDAQQANLPTVAQVTDTNSSAQGFCATCHAIHKRQMRLTSQSPNRCTILKKWQHKGSDTSKGNRIIFENGSPVLSRLGFSQNMLCVRISRCEGLDRARRALEASVLGALFASLCVIPIAVCHSIKHMPHHHFQNKHQQHKPQH